MTHFSQNPDFIMALALVVGIMIQILARHMKVPGIVLLLAAGVAIGPDGLSIINPAALGDSLYSIIGFAVAIILFEGSLQLDFRSLRKARRSIQQLVTIGALVTMAGGTLAAYLIMGLNMRTSLLFGSLVIVTGPTVISPLMRRLRVKRSVTTTLEAEGIFIDAVGVVIAALTIEIALSPTTSGVASGIGNLGLRIGTGLIIGALGGLFMTFILRKKEWIPEGLENVFTLCQALIIFQSANTMVHESGILAVTIAGLVVGNSKIKSIHDLVEFKEQLTVMMIGMLFILLAADVRISEVVNLGWPGIWVVLALIFIIRPLNIFIGTWNTELTFREKLFMSWIGPRGIIAAAIASLFAAELEKKSIEGAEELRALVFMVIAFTVALTGLTGGLVARLLGLKQTINGWVVLGAHELARVVAHAFQEDKQDVILIDSNPETCAEAELEGYSVIRGSALTDKVLSKCQIETRMGALGLSANEEVNLLFAQKLSKAGKLAHRFTALKNIGDIITPKMVHSAQSEVLFGCPDDVELWSVRIRCGLAKVENFQLVDEANVDHAEILQESRLKESIFLPLLVRQKKGIFPVTDQSKFKNEDQVVFLLDKERSQRAEERLLAMGWKRIATGEHPALRDTPTGETSPATPVVK